MDNELVPTAMENPDPPENEGTVFVIDDDELILASLTAALKNQGFEVVSSNSGEEALDLMKQQPPAVIVCDQFMPGMNGIDILKKAQELYPDTVRILMTGSHDLETAISAINIGQVNQYMTKPWKEAELLETINTSLGKYKLVKENKMLHALIFSQHKKLKKTNENLRHELRLGARIQEHLLLGKVPARIEPLSIETFSLPSKEIDGDFFEFYRPTSNILDLVIGDVMGKGIAAALVGTAIKTQMIRFAMPLSFRRSYERNLGWRDDLMDPAEILDRVHQEMSSRLIELEYFVCLFYCRFDFQYKTFSYVDCGSTKPLLFQAKTGEISELSGDNFPLGFFKDQKFNLYQGSFETGDIFVFYSDGVSEARSKSGDFFGAQRIVEILREHHEKSAKEICSQIRQSILQFSRKEKPDDDVTIVITKICPYEALNISEYIQTQFHADLSQLQPLRDFIKDVCRKAPGDNERLSSEMQLIINEAFCNIIKHGQLLSQKKTILINAELSHDGVLFTICDQGQAYDPSQVNQPYFSGSRDTGYGWHMIKQLAARVTYSRSEGPDGWNQLSVYKQYYLGDNTMDISHKTDGKVLVITFESGSLDARDANEFKEKVITVINDNKLKGVVFDLSKLDFIDSSGLGAFLSILRLMNSRGEDLKLSHLSKPVRTMFELVKMHKIFEIFNSTEDAVSSFK